MTEEEVLEEIYRLTDQAVAKLSIFDEACELLRSFLTLPTSANRKRLDMLLTEHQDRAVKRAME
jgi:hypothetical protein